MIINLFSVFDSFRISLYRNWLFFFFFIYFLFYPKYLRKSRFKVIIYTVINIVFKDLKPIIIKNNYLQVLFNCLFLILLINNFLGLIIYIFSTTSHLSLTLITRLVFWVSIFIVNIIYNMKNFFIHLVPKDISYFLMPLIILIETLRNLIRPVILGVRIRANIIAGHLLIVLVSQVLINSRIIFLLTGLGIIALVILERIVRIIQAYIFTILLRLYFSE